MLSCSVERAAQGCWEDRSIVSKASSKVVEARRSKLAHARAKGSIGMDQGTTCASMVAGQEEGLVTPEVVRFFFFWWGLLHGPQQGPNRMKEKIL